MTVELVQMLSLISFIVAGVLFLVAVALFFLLDVPKLYGDVSGRTAKKAIEEIRQQNEGSGNKAYKPSAVNANRGKLTDKITPSGRLQQTTTDLPIGVGTEKITVASQSNETTVLDTANETTVLDSSNETTVLSASNETTVLQAEPAEIGETTVLVNETAPQTPVVNDNFSVDVEMAFTGSSEIIE